MVIWLNMDQDIYDTFFFNVAMTVIAHNPTFYEFYRKKRSEGKCHLVALSHVVKKLIRVIFKLEKDNLMFNSNLLR